MNDNRGHQLAGLARRQHGAFSIEQASTLGFDRSLIARRAEAGIYRRLHPSVYCHAGAPDTRQQRLHAAVLSFRRPAAISHEAAAELWGLTQRSIDRIDVVTTRWDRVRRDRVRVHESLDLIRPDIVTIEGLPITTPERTVVDLGASNRWIVEPALEAGIRAGLFTLDDVDAFVARVARRGRRGVGVIRPLITSRRRWDAITDSELEHAFRRLVADAGLPAPEHQWEVRDRRGDFVARADFAYPDQRLLIELDSEAHHLDRLTFRRDRAKQNRAAVLGWTVLRYTWWDLKERPGAVCREVGALLASAPASA